MPYKIDPSDYAHVAPLFAPLAAFNVAIEAVRDGNNWGYILADDPQHPTAAMMHTVEGTHLAGQPSVTFAGEVNANLHQYYFSEERRALYFCATDGWSALLEVALAPYPIYPQERQHYVCRTLPLDMPPLPDGYQVRAIDAMLLADSTVTRPDHIEDWIEGNWGSVENYLARGFGMCITHEGRVVSWSLCDCVSGSRCEIGIQTDSAYRQRGLAAITTTACVRHAMTNGFTAVGWHCDAENIGSWKTALKVGFVKERDYRALLAVAPSA